MADNEEKEEPAARGNEWEVVSLTASTYAAAPNSDQVNVTEDENGNPAAEDEAAETSRALFMSGHFVFPPSQHENLPLETERNEICSVQGNEDAGFQSVGDEEIQSNTKEQAMMNTKGLTVPDEFPGIQFFDEKGNILPVGGTEYEEGTAFQGLNLVDKEQSLYNSETFSSFHSERMIGRAANVDEDTEITEIEEPYDHGLDSDLSKPTDEEYDESDLPCGAWWKRRAASFYAHAKEANTFWSVFIAAAVMGLVILGQQWQQERWQVLQLKWQFSISNERMSRVMGSLARFKDVIVGGQRRGSLIRASTSTEH
ncbi:unnamed protein product [Coffea canephora]|uniref:ATG8-interacting protein 1 n=2 Tax=Coffea TaxID=13442 RepID=A0A068UKH6_COFCA|nr:ATG8-interacting protein 2-like [Coffea arabica]XP_027108370.1 ATG8-interacting protein 2-like [Coffea arabica]XP_027108371.1 ATG8-interacting protein 2-like [Coffea arabica]CDP08797.1 unnamed protein product [Coffea canephora]